jgi:hypothetical protein
MLVDYEKALAVFDSFEQNQKVPYLHPYYVVADAKRDETLKPLFFVYEEDDSIFYHAFHMAPIEGMELFDIQSPYGYGGPVVKNEKEGFLSKAWSAYTAWCDGNNVLAEFIRFHPLLNNWHYYKGGVMDERETVWLNLINAELLSTYRELAKRGVRKAKRNGLSVEWWNGDQFLNIFPLLYNTFMTELNAEGFYHFTDTYFKKILTWENAHCAVCKLNDEIVTAAVFLVEANTMEYHLSASHEAGKKLGSVYLLMHEAALYGQQLGCKALHLGGGTDNNPDNPLLFFKSRFSNLRTPFKIGKQIYTKEVYNQMKNEWQDKHGAIVNRVLFYR